jgi:hypothetical protein
MATSTGRINTTPPTTHQRVAAYSQSGHRPDCEMPGDLHVGFRPPRGWLTLPRRSLRVRPAAEPWAGCQSPWRSVMIARSRVSLTRAEAEYSQFRATNPSMNARTAPAPNRPGPGPAVRPRWHARRGGGRASRARGAGRWPFRPRRADRRRSSPPSIPSKAQIVGATRPNNPGWSRIGAMSATPRPPPASVHFAGALLVGLLMALRTFRIPCQKGICADGQPSRHGRPMNDRG